MDVATLEKEIENLSSKDQERLTAFLAALHLKRDQEALGQLDAWIDDREPNNWISLHDLKQLRTLTT